MNSNPNKPRPDPPVKNRDKVTEVFHKTGQIIDDASGHGGVVTHDEAQPYMLERGDGDVPANPINPNKDNWPMPKEVMGE